MIKHEIQEYIKVEFDEIINSFYNNDFTFMTKLFDPLFLYGYGHSYILNNNNYELEFFSIYDKFFVHSFVNPPKGGPYTFNFHQVYRNKIITLLEDKLNKSISELTYGTLDYI